MGDGADTNVAKQQGTLFVRDVCVFDCAVFDPAKGIVGQSWIVDVELRGALDELGFVYDFGHLKALMRSVAKDSVDHALLIPVSSKSVDFSENERCEKWKLHATSKLNQTDQSWQYECPRGAVYPIRAFAIRGDTVAQELARLMRHRLPPSISDVKISLREEAAEATAAFFHYTHGVTGHDGYCQRLFHGHRSRIEVYAGEERRPDLEHYITRTLFGGEIHIADPNQILKGEIEIGMRGRIGESVEIGYGGSQGYFSAVIPADRVFMVENATSIERISLQLAQILRSHEKFTGPFKVVAYEGIGKGAVGIS